MKKFLLGIVAIFLCVFALVNISHAASTNTSKKSDMPHWQKKPISVYIPNDTGSAQMRNAFTKWQTASGNRIVFQTVATKDKADIVVTFTDKTDGLESGLGGYSTSIQGNKITKAQINIATKSKLAKKKTPAYMYKTMVHQVGHVLGMSDNNSKPSSIMYMPISENQDITKLDIKRLYGVCGWSYANRNMPSQRNKKD